MDIASHGALAASLGPRDLAPREIVRFRSEI
jgi:hypothetical protein